MPGPLVVPDGGGFLDIFGEYEQLPPWLTESDLDVYAADFERTGFTGGLNWYRAIDETWELMAAWPMASVLTPALYVVGDKDVVTEFPGVADLIPQLKGIVPNLTGTIVLPGCGHWTAQERPGEVNDALIRFLAAL
jgi:pimeloyl-ACP methyl ester carboxylesterase